MGQICRKTVTSLEVLIWRVQIRKENSIPDLGWRIDMGQKLKPMWNCSVGELMN